jgi:hypothetical protein
MWRAVPAGGLEYSGDHRREVFTDNGEDPDGSALDRTRQFVRHTATEASGE